MSWPPRAGALRATLVAALGFLLVADVPALFPQVTQSLEQLVVLRRRELDRARAEFDAAVLGFNVLDAQWQNALDGVTRARRSGDDDALERAWAEAQDRAGPIAAQEQRVESMRDSLAVARQALMDAVEARLDELLAQMERAPTATQRASLNALFVDLRNELQRLDEEGRGGVRLQPVVLPDVTFDPRDGPAEWAQKAQLLERHAALLQTHVDETSQRIRALNNRLRIRRQSGDLLASVDRFDDTRVPVVTGGPPRGEVPADSTGAGVRPLTLEEQIAELEEYRTALEARREQILIKAAIFRSRGGQITW